MQPIEIFPDQVILETNRLWLKELNPELMAMIFSSYTDGELKDFLGVTDAELETERQNFRKGMVTYRLSFKSFVMVEKETSMVIGRAGFHTWYLQHARAELGYAMTHEAAKRKGLMTEAVVAIIDYGFKKMDLNRIEAMVSPRNEASLKVLTKLGFTQEGLLRSHFFKNNVMEDSAIFSLLRNEHSNESYN